MRIWILNHYASPPDRPGGTRHYEFGRILARQGHEITIFASSFCHFSRREERLGPGERVRAEVIDGVRFVWVRTIPYTGNDFRRVRNMGGYALGVLRAQRRFPRPDVVVGSSVHLAAACAALLIGRVRRVPFVFEVRDLWPRTLIDMGALREGGILARSLTMLECFLYRRAAMVVVLLPHAARYITGLGIPGDKIAYVPNGVSCAPATASAAVQVGPADDQAAALVARIRQQRDAGRLVAGYVGSNAQANGVDMMVEAARELRDRGAGDVVLVFVGEGPEKARCERLAHEYGLANVLFWPPVPKRSVPAVLDALDVMLFCLRDIPVFKYGLSSNKLFDYLASGRPVIAACAIADSPVSLSGGGICVPPESPAAVADALLEMAALGDAGRRAVGERGRIWVRDNHDAADLTSRFLVALSRARQ
jgi:glycosyltransferase involved in cell wall biosynthesis